MMYNPRFNEDDWAFNSTISELNTAWKTGENLAEHFRTWACCPAVLRLKVSLDQTVGCIVEVELWEPYDCQGCYFPQCQMSYFPRKEIFWSRSSSEAKDKFWIQQEQTILEKALDFLLDIVTQAAKVIEISSLEHDLASEILYKKLLNNPRVTRLEFSNPIDVPNDVSPNILRALDLCCRLLAKSTTLEEVLFENLGKFDQKSIQRLFQSMETNSNLKNLDLRCSRHIYTWYKANRTMGTTDNPIHIESLISALLKRSPENQFALQQLDLSGNVIPSTSEICSLAKALPSLGLKRLSLRGCSLSETSLLAITKSLEKDKVLEELDLSHNSFTKPVMEQLVLSLQKNENLKTLTLEHCQIDIDQVRCLAQSFPDVRFLQRLHLDGNEFTWEPLSDSARSTPTTTTHHFVPSFPSAPLRRPLQDDSTVSDSVTISDDDSTVSLGGGEEDVSQPSHEEEESGSEEESGFEESGSEEEEDNGISDGATLMVDALEQNRSLLSLKMGQFGKIGKIDHWCMSCSTAPPYTPVLDDHILKNKETFLNRNQEILEERVQIRAQQAVVRIVQLLHSKMVEDGE